MSSPSDRPAPALADEIGEAQPELFQQTDAFGAGVGGLDDPFGESPLKMDTVSLDDPPEQPSEQPAQQPAELRAEQPPSPPPPPPDKLVKEDEQATTPAEAVLPAAPTPAHRAPAPASRMRSASSEPCPVSEMSEAIAQAASFDELVAALEDVQEWPWSPEQEAGIKRCKTYIPDRDVIAGFYVMSINEWRVSQPRVLVLTRNAYFRIKYDPQAGKVEHYHKTPLPELRALEKTLTGLKVYLKTQDGHSGPKKWASWMVAKVSRAEARTDEFQHAREYRSALPTGAGPSPDQVCDIIAASFAKASELLRENLPTGGVLFDPPNVITTLERKQILSERKAAARAEDERAEREAAEAELRSAVAVAIASRDRQPKTSGEINHAVLARPLRRAKRAVEADATLIDEAERLKAELEEELRERLYAERLERERVEREAATAELEAAITYAATSRDNASLVRALKRARKAVDVRSELLGRGEDLKMEIDAEKKAEREAAEEASRQRKLAERMERERVETQAATAELEAAVSAAETSRDTTWLVKALRRARRAAGVSADLLDRAESLKHEIDLEKKVAAEEARAAN